MRRVLIALLAVLTLSSCGTLDDAVDRAGDRSERLVTHTTAEVRKLKDELLKDISKAKTEILNEVGYKVEDVIPRVVNEALNADGVAFMITTLVILLATVVITVLLLLVGFFRALYARLRHPASCSARQQSK